MTLNNDSISQLSVLSYERIGKLRDNCKSDIEVIQSWIDGVIYQTEPESEIKKDRCEICRSKEEPDSLERHHLAGEKHDYRRITVCLACHAWLSNKQKTFDKRWLEENQPENLRQAFFLLGLQNILELKSIKTGNSLYRKLGESYAEKISTLLGRLQN